MNLEQLIANQEAESNPASNNIIKKKPDRPSACAKCGYSGHLTFQCRNFIPTQPNKEVICDVSSTDSETDTDDDGTTPLTKLRAIELKAKLEELKRSRKAERKKIKAKREKKKLKKAKKERRKDSSSSSDEKDKRHKKRLKKSKESRKDKDSSSSSDSDQKDKRRRKRDR